MKSMTRLTALSLLALLACPPAFAASFAEKCPDVLACASAVGELLGQKYTFDTDVKGRMYATPNLEFTKENAELLFTNMLNINGFSRVPLGTAGSYVIMRQRDARDSALPFVSCDKATAPELPDTWDLYTMSYKMTAPELTENMARSVRSFMPANSRIVPHELTGLLLITDTALNLKKIYRIIRDLDQKPSPEALKRQAEARKPLPPGKGLGAAPGMDVPHPRGHAMPGAH